VKSDLSVRAALMWAQYIVVHQTDIVGTAHVSHELNTRTDNLSRPGGSWAAVVKDDKQNYGGTYPNSLPFLDLDCGRLLDLVDPRKQLLEERDYIAFF
jgi:hypothetical protein